MVPPTLQDFLSQALNRTVPSPSNLSGFASLLDVMLPVLDLTAASRRIEWVTGTITLTGSNKPQFDFPPVPVDEIQIYRHIGVSNSAGAGNETWRVEVAYPGVANPFQEGFTINLTEPNLNILTIGPASSSNAQRMGRPLLVYPRGALRVRAGASGVATEVFTCNAIREIQAGPFSAEFQDGVIAASEV